MESPQVFLAAHCTFTSVGSTKTGTLCGQLQRLESWHEHPLFSQRRVLRIVDVDTSPKVVFHCQPTHFTHQLTIVSYATESFQCPIACRQKSRCQKKQQSQTERPRAKFRPGVYFQTRSGSKQVPPQHLNRPYPRRHRLVY